MASPYRNQEEVAKEMIITDLKRENDELRKEVLKMNKKSKMVPVKHFLLDTPLGSFITTVFCIVFYFSIIGMSYGYFVKNCTCISSNLCDRVNDKYCCSSVGNGFLSLVWPVSLPAVFSYRLISSEKPDTYKVEK